MKISINTDMLHLPGQGVGAGWVTPSTVSADEQDLAIQELLALGLSEQEIQRLQVAIEEDNASQKIMKPWPSQGEDRKSLEATAKLCLGLSTIVNGLSPRAHAELATAALQATGAVSAVFDLPKTLLQIGNQLQQRLRDAPTQSRPKPRTQLVRAVWNLQSARLGAPNKYPESPFYRACQQVFILAGIGSTALPPSPDRAIDALVRSLPK